MSNSIAPGSSAAVNVNVTALTTNPNVPVQYKTIILKKNLVNGANTLTQAMMNQANIKYVIKYDYVLGEDITIPANCVLEFDGGSISGEYILNLNSCGIIGKGLKCEISNPINANYNLSSFLSDISNTTLNRKVVQCLLDNNVTVINDYSDYIEFDNYLSIKNSARVSGGKWKFNTSRGFVWDTATYSAGNLFENLVITSEGHCFDFVNSDAVNRPLNVFKSKFIGITATSLNGDCFTAGGNNKGSGGDNCCFDNHFEDITVRANNGCGFKSFTSNSQYFTICRCDYCADSLFYNCSGIFENCNGTWGETPTFYKARAKADGGQIEAAGIFRRCNIESYKGVLIDCQSATSNLIFEQCDFDILADNGNDISHYPVYLTVVRCLKFIDCTFWTHGGTFIGNYAPLYVGSFEASRMALFTDKDIEMFHDSVKTTVFGNIKKADTFMLSATYNKIIFDKYQNISVEKFKVGMIDYDRKSITVSNNSTVLPLNTVDNIGKVIGLRSETDNVGGNINLNRIDCVSLLNTSYKNIPLEFYIVNANANASFTFVKSYGTTFVGYDGTNISIQPGECVKLIMFYNDSVAIVMPISKETVAINRAGESTVRPSSPTIGFQYFDTTLNKPIYWNGTAWVDATGATV